MYKGAIGTSDNFYHVPILSSLVAPSIFISYSTKSKWCSNIANRFVNHFKNNNIDYFIDIEKIPEGESWRFCLYSAIHHSSLIVILLDKFTAQSQWVAEELETALISFSLIGTPQIIIIFEKEYLEKNEKNDKTTLPVFHTAGHSILNKRFKSLDWCSPIGVIGTEEYIKYFEETISGYSIPRLGLLGFRLSKYIKLINKLISKIIPSTVLITTGIAIYSLKNKEQLLTYLTEFHLFPILPFFVSFASGYIARSLVLSLLKKLSKQTYNIYCIFDASIVFPYIIYPLSFIICNIIWWHKLQLHECCYNFITFIWLVFKYCRYWSL
ncbi:membrane protein containing Toll-Interleukin receptor domain protein [Candidatus Magnetomorum sp. HK-1]|nr:membrane protein containing Toll-Interleukin receptor domain protein [Candidatus Magnetomorum sp. HK-1]